LFQRNITIKTKTELLIFLTPHVAQQPATLKPISEDELQGTKLTPTAVEPGTFDEHMRGLKRGSAESRGSKIQQQPTPQPQPQQPQPRPQTDDEP
jgi:type II secretory pathway component GspD/PulD (secretin)